MVWVFISLLVNCKDENCKVHSKEKKVEFRKRYKSRQ